jgi:EmrB/QacA subfamily drug resistance transporter
MNFSRRNLAFATVVLGFFMALLDSTIVSVSLPKMTEYFNTQISTISWVINAYNLACAVLFITASRLADQFGRRRIFMIGLLAFTLTSLLCGLAPTVEWLIFLRVLQGLSAALLVPVSMPLMLGLFPAEKMGLVVGVWGAISAVAAASGPALGGVITELFHWQWIFYINVPIGIITFVMGLAVLEESFDPTATRYIDWRGIITLSAGCFSLTLGLIQANDYGWGSVYVISLLVVAAVSLTAFAVIEAREPEPMLPLHLLHRVSFSAGMVSMLMQGVTLMCGVFFMAFFLTLIMDMSQLKAGLVITAIPLSAMIFAIPSGAFTDRVDGRWFSIPGIIITCVATWLCGQLTPHSTVTDVVWRLCLAGAGFGLGLPAIVGGMIKSVPSDKIGIGSGVGNTARITGMVFGVAVLVTLLTHFANQYMEEAKVKAIAVVNASVVLKQEAKQTFVNRISETRFSQQTRLPTAHDVVARLEARRDEAIATAGSDMQKAVLRTVYKRQIGEVTRMYPEISGHFKHSLAEAFSRTFRLMAWLVSIGVLIALFGEPGKGDASPRPRSPGAVHL